MADMRPGLRLRLSLYSRAVFIFGRGLTLTDLGFKLQSNGTRITEYACGGVSCPERAGGLPDARLIQPHHSNGDPLGKTRRSPFLFSGLSPYHTQRKYDTSNESAYCSSIPTEKMRQRPTPDDRERQVFFLTQSRRLNLHPEGRDGAEHDQSGRMKSPSDKSKAGRTCRR